MTDELTAAGAQTGSVRLELREIARAEFGRQRRRLGELTPEQETAIEALLLSAADRIARPVVRAMSLGAA